MRALRTRVEPSLIPRGREGVGVSLPGLWVMPSSLPDIFSTRRTPSALSLAKKKRPERDDPKTQRPTARRPRPPLPLVAPRFEDALSVERQGERHD